MTQERYHEYMLRRYKEDMKELREDKMDVDSLNAAINHYALTHDMTVHQVQAMIQESPQARNLVMSFYWEKNTL